MNNVSLTNMALSALDGSVQGSANSFYKRPDSDIGFAGDTVSVAVIQLCACKENSQRESQSSGRGYVPMKLIHL